MKRIKAVETAHNQLTLCSLFDGSGGFPLGATLAGIKPVSSSEIAPFAILVTSRRLPDVKHYGDVSEIKGSELEPVDIITFGSPCQDMSIAGRRTGLDGERSGLFHQAIRIIKEMREATDGKYPRYCVWENVPGAFSSNGGDDFKAVLESVIGVKEEGIEVPAPDKNKWSKADVYLGDGWSLAYRVFDTQYWGCPQRRKRIYLVADFAGERAGEILFESESLRGDSQESGEAREDSPGDAEGSIGRDDQAKCLNVVVRSIDCRNSRLSGDKSGALQAKECGGYSLNFINPVLILNDQGGQVMDVSEKAGCLRAQEHGHQPVVAYPIENHAMDSRVTLLQPNEPCQTLSSMMGGGGGNVPMVLIDSDQKKDKSYFTQQSFGEYINGKSSSTVTAHLSKEQSDLVLERDTSHPKRKYIVRRLTPTECARLQGFPDWWCADLAIPDPTDEQIAFWTEVWETWRKVTNPDSKPKTEKQIRRWLASPYTDANEYKLWGNGISLPIVYFVLSRIVKVTEEEKNNEDH